MGVILIIGMIVSFIVTFIATIIHALMNIKIFKIEEFCIMILVSLFSSIIFGFCNLFVFFMAYLPAYHKVLEGELTFDKKHWIKNIIAICVCYIASLILTFIIPILGTFLGILIYIYVFKDINDLDF